MQRTKPLRGGKDPGLVHKPSASATRPIDSDFAPCLYQRAAPCYSSAWLRLAAASVRFSTSRSPGTLPRTRPLPIYSIYVKAKAVPVAASSSEIASARPTGSELTPRSFTALRIQHSSEAHASTGGQNPSAVARPRCQGYGSLPLDVRRPAHYSSCLGVKDAQTADGSPQPLVEDLALSSEPTVALRLRSDTPTRLQGWLGSYRG